MFGITSRLFSGDCLEVLPALAAGSVDLVLCDLPYGITQNKWDVGVDLPKLWEAYKRICTPTAAIVLTAAQPFTSVLVCSNLKGFRYEWIWDKVNLYTNVLNAKKMPLRRHESVLIFGRYGTYNEQWVMKPRVGGGLGSPGRSMGTTYGKVARTRNPSRTATSHPVPHHAFDILSIPSDLKKEKGLHPTQKPIALMEYMVKTYTNPGDTVLDNCMGSGTTGVACVNTGRSFIGIEKDAGYYDIAKLRIHEAEQKIAVRA